MQTFVSLDILGMSTTNSHIPGSSAKAAGTDIPIGHLDYNYVKDCTNVTELEEIITILRFVTKTVHAQSLPAIILLALSFGNSVCVIYTFTQGGIIYNYIS